MNIQKVMGIIIEVKAVLFVTTLPLPFPPSSLQLGNFFHMYEVDILKKKCLSCYIKAAKVMQKNVVLCRIKKAACIVHSLLTEL